MSWEVRLGECLETLKGLPDNSVDSCVTDPPYNLSAGKLRVGIEQDAVSVKIAEARIGHAAKSHQLSLFDEEENPPSDVFSPVASQPQ